MSNSDSVRDAEQHKRLTCNCSDLASRNVTIGDIHYNYGNYNLAIDSYTQALQCSVLGHGERCQKDIGLFLQKRANSLLRIGKYREAHEDAKEKIRLNPKDISGHIIAAVCSRYTGDGDASTASMQKSSSYFAQLSLVVENIKLALQAKQHDHAQLSSLCREFLEYSPFNVAFQLACSYFCILSKERALGIQTTLLKYNNVYQLAPVADHCLQELQQNLEMAKRFVTFYEANVALRNRNYEKALELFSSLTEAVAIRDYYLGRSETLMQMGRLEEAVNDCNTASTLPGNQDWAVYKLRGQIYMMEMQKFKEAVQQFESLFFQMVDKEHAGKTMPKATHCLKKENVHQQLSHGSHQSHMGEKNSGQMTRSEKRTAPPKKRTKLNPISEK